MVKPNKFTHAETASAAPCVPSEFVRVTDRFQQPIDRKLGYVGQDRFVFFRFVPRCDGAIWNDGRSYGFGYGAWLAFDEVLPLGERYGASFGGSDGPDEHVLLVDRMLQQVYIGDRRSAETIVARQNGARAEV